LCTMLSAAPAAASGCGQLGERACCIFEAPSACGAGLAEVAGCLGDCECSNLPGTPSLSSCIQATPCGGEGQRACFSATNEGAACQSGLEELPFSCSGDCLCGGFNPLYTASLGTCIDPHFSPVIAEPSTNWTAPEVPLPACELIGYADMHAHMFAEYAHG